MISGSQLKSTNLFIQASTINSSFSMPKIGKIITEICTNNEKAVATTSNNNLSIANPIDGIFAIDVNATDILANVDVNQNNISEVIANFADKVIQISEILEVNNYIRLGERRQYTKLFETSNLKLDYLKKFVKGDDFEDVSISKLVKHNNYKAQIKIIPTNNSDNKGIIIDIDIFYCSQLLLTTSNIKQYIIDINNNFNSILEKFC